MELGFNCIRTIYDIGGQLHLAVTLEDQAARDKSGRIYLDEFCSTHDVPLIKIKHVNDAAVLEAVAKHQIDWLFIVGWSQIAGADVLKAPTRGCIGIHPTLLPIGRGRAPIPWAIIKGLEKTGVTMFVLDEGVDTGPIIAQEELPIAANETATSLYKRVADAHSDLIRNNWLPLVNDTVIQRAQNDAAATEWPGRRPEDGRIRSDMTVAEVDRLVRGVTRPYPGAFYESDGGILRVWAGQATDTMSEDDVNRYRSIRLCDGIYRAEDWDWVDGN